MPCRVDKEVVSGANILKNSSTMSSRNRADVRILIFIEASDLFSDITGYTERIECGVNV